MMFSWIRRGLRTGILTTRYPAVHEQMPDGFRGRPVLDASRCLVEQGCNACVQACLPGALNLVDIVDGEVTRATGEEVQQLALDYARCIMCGLCVTACPECALRMTEDYELAANAHKDLRIVAQFVLSEENEDGKEEPNGRFA